MKTFKVEMSGTRSILFDRYPGDNRSKLEPHEKFYLYDGNKLCIPIINVYSLLASENGKSAVKQFGREGKKIGAAVLSCVKISADDGNIERAPLLHKDGSEIVFNSFEDPEFEVMSHVARLKNGIPNPTKRPAYKGDWKIQLKVQLEEDKILKPKILENIFTEAGKIGVGTFRPFFGQFELTTFEEI